MAFENIRSQFEKALHMAGIVVSLEEELMLGHSKILTEINKDILVVAGISKPRLSLGYSMIKFFTDKV